MRSKLKLSFISNESSRKKTFMKRKRGMMKKLHELTTRCGVQACAVICSPYQSVLESWPSKKGVKEVISKFMEVPIETQTKNMMDQQTYMQERIAKGQKKVDSLIQDNKELLMRQFMFDCVEGKMLKYRYDATDLHDLQCYIQKYIDLLTRRIKFFTESRAITVPIEVYDHIQYQNMNMSQNLQESIQHHIPINFCDFFQNEKINMNQHQQEAVQYQIPTNLYDQIQLGIYNMNMNQNMNLDSNHNLNLSLNMNSNQYPNQQQSSMDLRLEQQIGYIDDHTSIPFIDENHYNYHQLPTAGQASSNHMPSTITTNGVYPPYVNNNL